MANANIYNQPLHLGLGGTATVQPPFTGMEWYDAYVKRTAADGAEGRLVSTYRFSESWDAWEMHPAGDEVVICLEGQITLHQEMPGGKRATVTLNPGDYAINPPGCWHTADVTAEAAALFITPGQGTQHRPRHNAPTGDR